MKNPPKSRACFTESWLKWIGGFLSKTCLFKPCSCVPAADMRWKLAVGKWIGWIKKKEERRWYWWVFAKGLQVVAWGGLELFRWCNPCAGVAARARGMRVASPPWITSSCFQLFSTFFFFSLLSFFPFGIYRVTPSKEYQTLVFLVYKRVLNARNNNNNNNNGNYVVRQWKKYFFIVIVKLTDNH